jgi:hypothetical protein
MPKALRGFYAHLANTLGLTESGLTVLFRLKRGDQISGGNAGIKLEAQGLVTACGWDNPTFKEGKPQYIYRTLTDAGKEICERARKLGY